MTLAIGAGFLAPWLLSRLTMTSLGSSLSIEVRSGVRLVFGAMLETFTAGSVSSEVTSSRSAITSFLMVMPIVSLRSITSSFSSLISTSPWITVLASARLKTLPMLMLMVHHNPWRTPPRS